MRPMVNLLSFGGSLSLYPIDEHVRCARERYEQAETIRNTRRFLGCDEAKMSCVSCRQGCPHEGQTMVST